MRGIYKEKTDKVKGMPVQLAKIIKGHANKTT